MDSAYLSDLFSVEGKVIVLTGGGGVLCGAMARGLARLGARVALVDIRPEAAEQVARDVNDAGGEALPLYGDVTDKATLDPCAEKILERYGSIDALISGAGGNRPEATTTPDMTFFDLPEASLRSVLDLNFTGTVLSAQVFGKHMAERGEGAIINIASINAIRPLTKILAYSAGKAAVKNFTEWLAVHISQHFRRSYDYIQTAALQLRQVDPLLLGQRDHKYQAAGITKNTFRPPTFPVIDVLHNSGGSDFETIGQSVIDQPVT